MRAGEGGSIAGTINFIPEIISLILQGGSKRLNLPSFINELIKDPIFGLLRLWFQIVSNQ